MALVNLLERMHEFEVHKSTFSVQAMDYSAEDHPKSDQVLILSLHVPAQEEISEPMP